MLAAFEKLRTFLRGGSLVAVEIRKRVSRRQRLFDRLTSWIPLLRYLLIRRICLPHNVEIFGSLVLVFTGYLYVFAIPWSALSRRTYMSENAIQPAQVNTYWSWGEVHTADRFAEEVQKWANWPPQERADAIRAIFSRHGLMADTQAYSFLPGENSMGVNVYGIMRTAKTDGAESIVLSASWLSRTEGEINTRGIAILLSLSKYLSKLPVWSKDVVFVISDGYLDGLQAWTIAWHGHSDSRRPRVSSQVVPVLTQDLEKLLAEPIRLRSGSIWAALHIDYPYHSYDHLGIYYEAANGLLPNLDFINSAIHIARWAGGSQVCLHDHVAKEWQISALNRPYINAYLTSAINVLDQVRWQASGSPSGPEGVFGRYRIDAIALYAIPAEGPHGFHALGKTIESLLRSLNNLLERFHQSFFLYLLTQPDSFISLANYLPAPLLVSVGLTLQGIASWVNLYAIPGQKVNRPILLALLVALGAHLYGLGLYLLSTISGGTCAAADDWRLLTAAITLITPSTAWVTAWLASSRLHLAATLRCITLLSAGIALAVVSTLNFSLGMLSAICLGLPLVLQHHLPRHISLVLAIMMTPSSVALLMGLDVTRLYREWRLLGTWFLPYEMVIVTPLLLQCMMVALLH